MSLLNDMLTDLNKKKMRGEPSVLSIPSSMPLHFSQKMFKWLGLICITAVVSWGGLQFLKFKVLPTPPKATKEVTIKEAMPVKVSRPAAPVRRSQPTRVAQENYREALEAIQNGEDPRAIELLGDYLIQYPESVEARENLAMIYLSHKAFEKAHATLDDGLIILPYNLKFTVLKARILVEEGQLQRALNLLKPFHPDIQKFPDYYALVAAIFESLNMTQEAGHIYQSLLRVDPKNGQYWLGLGIALENKHDRQQAISAYTQASQSHSSQEIAMYAQDRLKALQG